MSAVGNFFQTKLVLPIKNQLVQGATPQGLALTCAIGSMIGIFPILGVTTFLCVVIGISLKLNQPILQAVNYLLYPLQILMIPVFLTLGQSLTQSEQITFNPKAMSAEFTADPRLFLSHYGMAGLHAILIWIVFAPILAWLVYQLSLRFFRRWRREA